MTLCAKRLPDQPDCRDHQPAVIGYPYLSAVPPATVAQVAADMGRLATRNSSLVCRQRQASIAIIKKWHAVDDTRHHMRVRLSPIPAFLPVTLLADMCPVPRVRLARPPALRQVTREPCLPGNQVITFSFEPFEYRPEVIASPIDQTRNLCDRSLEAVSVNPAHGKVLRRQQDRRAYGAPSSLPNQSSEPDPAAMGFSPPSAGSRPGRRCLRSHSRRRRRAQARQNSDRRA